MRHGGDDRRMIVAPARERDMSGIAARRIAAFRPDQQRRSGDTAVFQRNSHAARVAHDLGGVRGHHHGDVRRGFRRVAKRSPQKAVLEHDPERLVAFGRVELQPAGLKAVTHPDRSDGAALPLQPLSHADRLQHAPRRARNRRRAAIIMGRQRIFRIDRIDDDAGKAVPVQRHRQSEPNQAAAQDDYVSSLHFPDLAMHRCNAKRLTAESGSAHCNSGNIRGIG